ncbi:MAG: hypothetical protein ABIG11_10015 [bacterium]
MNFFRLRVLNTLLFFLVGAGAGYLLRDRLFNLSDSCRNAYGRYPAASLNYPVPAAEKPALVSSSQVPPPVKSEEPDDTFVENPEDLFEKEPPADYSGTAAPRAFKPAKKTEKAPGQAPAASIGREAGEFLASPSSLSGKELEFELQMLVARRIGSGWRLNFSFPEFAKKVYYLYVDDSAGVLGRSPDVRIGYFYLVRFKCQAGDLNTGNLLISIKPTGGKASWATGLSAIE